MLHDIIKEQGNCLDVRAGISEKILFSHVSYISQASGALIIRVIVTVDIKPTGLCDRCYK